MEVSKAIELQYHDFVAGLILVRLRIICLIGAFVYIFFTLLDRISYPLQAPQFFQIRLFNSLLLFLIFVLTFWKKLRPYLIWLTDIGALSSGLLIAVMVFLSDGSSSRYYEGGNLVLLAGAFVNIFYTRHLIFICLIQIISYEAAMIFGGDHFNTVNFYYANYFMVCSAFFIVLLSRSYSEQHYQAFARQEQLKINEAKLAELYKQADLLAKTDELTAIYNRRHFFKLLNEKIASCEAAKTSFYLVIFDVDHFKDFNDNYGHSFGDETLVKVVNVVKKNTRTEDFLGRYGGDEFIICLDIPKREAIIKRLEKISNEINALNLMHNGQTVPVSVSIGAAKFKPDQNLNVERLMELADEQLFNVKKSGRGQYNILE